MPLLKSHMPVLPLLAISIPLLTGCPANPPETAASVDIARYMGKWYEIAKYPVFFEKGLVGVTAEYTLQDNGTVRLINRGFRSSFDGKLSEIQGTAKVADPTTNAKLKIRFDPFPTNLFRANYWIIEVGENYEYAVVSNASRSVLWILARTPQMDETVYQDLCTRLAGKGFDPARFELMPQPAS